MPGKNLGAAHWKRVAGRIEPGLGETYRTRLICPDDDAPLVSEDEGGHRLGCPACGRRYEVQKGILPILPSTERLMASPADIERLNAQASENRFISQPEDEFGRLWPHVSRLAGECGGKRVLDLCCGTGWGACWFAARGARVAALDIVAGEDGLASVAGARRERGLSFDIFQADICRLPFVEETFDVVFIANATHAVARPEVLLGEAARVLAPGGIVLNIAEPIGEVSNSFSLGGTDPRREGKTLTPSDYQAIYQEAGLTFQQIAPHDNASETGGMVSRVMRHIKLHSTSEDRLFAGRRERPFSFSNLSIGKRNV